MKVPKLNITDNNIQIKQNSKLIYFICILNKTMLAKSKTLKLINRINSRLKFLHMKKLRYVIYDVMLLFNLTLIMSSASYPKLTQKMKKKSKPRKTNAFGIHCNHTK